MRGHFYHQWCELPDGTRIDLAEDAADVLAMLRWEIPDYSKFGVQLGERLPRPLYTHREKFMRSKDAREMNASHGLTNGSESSASNTDLTMAGEGRHKAHP